MTPQYNRFCTSRFLVSRLGATTVEFSLVASILFIFILGSIELARVSIVRHVADQASYEACRMVIVPGSNTSEAQAHVDTVLARYGVSGATVTVSPDPILESTAAVTVNVTVPADGNRWGLSGLTGGLALNSSTTLLTERAPIVQSRAVPEPPPPPPPTPPPPKPQPPPHKKNGEQQKGEDGEVEQ
ncbi:MAG TPA: pilus assembly protein TadE, partial [Planctomycetaceae bacterium]|nr:pilus assembly protein TadE [Planctomycetaceae bacterium]